MAGLGKAFNPTDHDTEQRADFPNLPNGDYRLEISASKVKSEPGKTGLSVTIDVLEPEAFKGRKIFGNYNLEHPKAQAQEIGQKQFAQLCRALGISDPVEDSEDLHFIAFTATVGMGKDGTEMIDEAQADGSVKKVPKYKAKNEIKKYFYPDEGAPPAPKAAPVASNDNAKPANDNKPAAAAAAPAGKRPWAPKKTA